MIFDVLRHDYRAGDIFCFIPQIPDQGTCLAFGVYKSAIGEAVGIFHNCLTGHEETWDEDHFKTFTKFVPMSDLPPGKQWDEILSISKKFRGVKDEAVVKPPTEGGATDG